MTLKKTALEDKTKKKKPQKKAQKHFNQALMTTCSPPTTMTAQLFKKSVAKRSHANRDLSLQHFQITGSCAGHTNIFLDRKANTDFHSGAKCHLDTLNVDVSLVAIFIKQVTLP